MSFRANLIIFSILISTLIACSNDSGSQSDDCTAGLPEAVFSPEVEGVENHNFVLNGRQSTETFQFPDGVKVEILQSGCEKVRQEYRFTFQSETLPDDASWLQAAGGWLTRLGALGPEYQVYLAWRDAIMQQGTNFKVGAPAEVGPGFLATIDRISGDSEQILIIILEEGQE